MIGLPLDQIQITGVRVRNLTATSGQAEVEYQQPVKNVGNDNWVTYNLVNGRWKVAGQCAMPIGQWSSSASSAS